MNEIFLSLLFSVGVHVVLALTLVWGVERMETGVDETVRLDLTKMEVAVVETAPSSAAPPSERLVSVPPAAVAAPRPAPVPPPQTTVRQSLDVQPPPASTTVFAEPKEEAPATLSPPSVPVAASTAGHDAAEVDVPVRLSRAFRPVYPPAAKAKGIEGKVVLRVSVSAEGKLLDVEVIRSSGSDLLDAAALKAVRRADFSPARRVGRAVETTIELPIQFLLKNGSRQAENSGERKRRR